MYALFEPYVTHLYLSEIERKLRGFVLNGQAFCRNLILNEPKFKLL